MLPLMGQCLRPVDWMPQWLKPAQKRGQGKTCHQKYSPSGVWKGWMSQLTAKDRESPGVARCNELGVRGGGREGAWQEAWWGLGFEFQQVVWEDPNGW